MIAERFPPRIAALIPSNEAIGPGRQLIALARALPAAGIECLIVGFHKSGRPLSSFAHSLRNSGVQYRLVEDRGPLDWRMASEIGSVLHAWRPSIVQTHGYKASAVAYLLRTLGFPWAWIGFFHGSTSGSARGRFYQWVDRRLLASAARVVVMSEAQARAFRHCNGRVRTIYNAALTPTPVGDAAERDRLTALAGTLRRPVIGVVGRLSPEKGVDLFLDACAVLVRKGLPFSALVAGDGPERARLEAQQANLCLETRVRFVGQVWNVDALYRNLDLLVLPSRSEGLPNALLEAVQADLPVVATAVGAVPEVVGSSPAAQLVPPGSSAALAEAIERALIQGDSPETAAARRDLVHRLSLDRRVQAHVQLYRELLEGGGAGEAPACAGSPAR